MTFNSLKQTVNRVLEPLQFDIYDETTNNVNRVLTGILTLNHLRQMISLNAKYNTDTGAVAKEYINTYKNIAESLKGKYISYKMIYNRIVNSKLFSFMNVTEKDVFEVLKLYENKEQVKTFSVSYFSQHMYNITGLNDKEYNALQFAHEYIISPIAEHYITLFDLQYSDVSADVESIGFCGKTIKLSISGVKNSRIVADIDKNIFGNSQYLYEYSLTSDGFVKIILK